MAVSKALEKLEAGELGDDDSYRDRILGYYRSRCKTKLRALDLEIITRSEITQEILMQNRTDLPLAKKMIKERFKLTHREEVDRYIEDAKFLFGAAFTVDRNYQRMMQNQDIEFAIAIAKTDKNWDLFEKMLLRREKLYQLDQPDHTEQWNSFSLIRIIAEVKFIIDKADMKEGEKMKLAAMKKLGMVEDIEELTDVEYS